MRIIGEPTSYEAWRGPEGVTESSPPNYRHSANQFRY